MGHLWCESEDVVRLQPGITTAAKMGPNYPIFAKGSNQRYTEEKARLASPKCIRQLCCPANSAPNVGVQRLVNATLHASPEVFEPQRREEKASNTNKYNLL